MENWDVREKIRIAGRSSTVSGYNACPPRSVRQDASCYEENSYEEGSHQESTREEANREEASQEETG